MPSYSKLVFKKTGDFIETYGYGIIDAIANTGLFFPAVIGQSCLESFYGSDIPKGSNNFGGIKYNPNLYGVVGYVDSVTEEVVRGVRIKRVERFAKFKDVQTGFLAHINLLLGNRYKNARLNAKDPIQQVRMIVLAGYATEPVDSYMRRCKPIIEAARDYSQLGRINVATSKTQKESEPTEYVTVKQPSKNPLLDILTGKNLK